MSSGAEYYRLRAATFLSPSIPVEFFESVLHYLERKLGLHTTLMYESRWEAPPKDRPNPFELKELDIAWLGSTAFLRATNDMMPQFELLPISSVHLHSRSEDRPGIYADVIIHRDLSKKVKEFIDLRGCKWATNHADSFSGHIATLQTLRTLGENASFFGNVLSSASHLQSIQMVLSKKADAAAIDANCLALFLDRNPHFASDLKVLTSWGMLSPYPLVVNTNLPTTVRKEISECLLGMDRDVDGAKKLAEFRVRRFAPIHSSDFAQEQEVLTYLKNDNFSPVYY